MDLSHVAMSLGATIHRPPVSIVGAVRQKAAETSKILSKGEEHLEIDAAAGISGKAERSAGQRIVVSRQW